MDNIVIDTATTPFIPDGLGVVAHRTNGPLVWDAEKIVFYEPERRIQVTTENDEAFRSVISVAAGEGVDGLDVVEQLKDKVTVNASVLDFLIKHQELIPDSWKANEEGVPLHIYFLGTIYGKPDETSENYCACYLYWNGKYWDWSYSMLVYTWDSATVAAIIK